MLAVSNDGLVAPVCLRLRPGYDQNRVGEHWDLQIHLNN